MEDKEILGICLDGAGVGDADGAVGLAESDGAGDRVGGMVSAGVRSVGHASAAEITCNAKPALLIGSATWAMALATRRQVETTPTTGANGRIFFTNLGKNLLSVIPIAMGARTT